LFCGIVSIASLARANSGTQIPLGQMQAGSEVTAPNLVLNPGFEATTAGQPNNWIKGDAGTDNMQIGAPINPGSNPSVLGVNAAQALTNQLTSTDPENYHYTTNGTSQAVITFDQSKTYVLSGYLWNFGIPDPVPGDFNPSDLALVELDDVDNVSSPVNIATFRNGTNGDSSTGEFDYISFPGSAFPDGATLDVRGDLGDNFSGTRPDVYAQFDNIAITDAADFVPPTLTPEPASLAILGLAAVMGLRRRK
jgi:hypothetical protein